MYRHPVAVSLICSLLLACSDDTSSLDTIPHKPDVLAVDSQTPDAGPMDQAVPDGPTADSQTPDAAPMDQAAPDQPLALDLAPADGPLTDDGPQPADGPQPTDGPLTDAARLATCQQLNADYLAQVALAKKCSPMLTVVQCTTLITNKLTCPCPTYAEQANTAALQLLTKLTAQWNALACGGLFACPAIPCYLPSSATCTQSSGTTGVCKDN